MLLPLLAHSPLAAPARHRPSPAEEAGYKAWTAAVLNPWGAGMWEAYGGPWWGMYGQNGAWAQGPKPLNKGGQTAEAAAAAHFAERQGGGPSGDRFADPAKHQYRSLERTSRHSAEERLDAIRRSQRKADAAAAAQIVPQALREPRLAVEPHLGAGAGGASPPSVRTSRWGSLGDLWAPDAAVPLDAAKPEKPHGWAHGFTETGGAGRRVAGPQ